MADNAPEINMRLKAGAPFSAISRSAIQLTADFVKYLTIRNGRLIRNGNRFTIECGGTGTAQWSGRVWFGGYLVLNATGADWLARTGAREYVRVDLKTGEVTGSDVPTVDLDQYEYYHVATKTVTAGPPETTTYALNSYTCGDIRCRIT
jgi:hypothetical protein